MAAINIKIYGKNIDLSISCFSGTKHTFLQLINKHKSVPSTVHSERAVTIIGFRHWFTLNIDYPVRLLLGKQYDVTPLIKREDLTQACCLLAFP